jgi:hypothetical protein
MAPPLALPLALTAASAIGSVFAKPKKNKIPWEVADAWDKLREFGMSGKIGNYTAGQDYGGPLGNYDKSQIETTGQNKLLELLTSARPEMFDAATNELKSLLSPNSSYDPYNERGLYKGFAENVDRATLESTDALKRSAAFGGSLYSRDTMKRLGNLQEQGMKQKSDKLAELYDTFAQRRLSAVPMAASLGQAQEGLDQGRIGAAFQYGGLDRTLADSSAKASYADFLRKQSEKQGQIGALQAVGGGYPGQTYSPSPYESVLTMLSTLGGYGLMNSFNGSGGGGNASSGYLPPSLSLLQPNWMQNFGGGNGFPY